MTEKEREPEELKAIWCLWVGQEDTDYVLNSWDIDLLPELYQQDNIRFEYNQWNQSWSRVSCTIFAAVWMVSDLMNYEFSLSEIKEIDNLSYDNPKYHIRKKWDWWYTKDAVDLVCNWWNENKSELGKIAYYRVSKFSDMVDKILEKWYTMVTNFCPTVEYAQDYYLSDWILDWYEFWNKTNGHAIWVIWDNHRAIKDNYKGRRTSDNSNYANIYEVKNPLAKITNYSQWLYVYTKVQEDNLEEIKRLNEIKAKCNVIIDHLGDLRKMVNDENFRGILHYTANKCRKKIQDADEQLKKYL
jgi:hypothetical protein